MDIGKIGESIEKYVRGYVLSILSILTNPRAIPYDGSAEKELTLSSARTWTYAILSIILGTIAHTAGTDPSFNPTKPTSTGFLLTLWLWILAGLLAHAAARTVRGKGTLVDSLGVVLRILPVAYLISGLMALTVGLFSRPISGSYSELAEYAALFTQFVIIFILFPGTLARVHCLSIPRSVALGALLAVYILAINIVTLVFLFEWFEPQAAIQSAIETVAK